MKSRLLIALLGCMLLLLSPPVKAELAAVPDGTEVVMTLTDLQQAETPAPLSPVAMHPASISLSAEQDLYQIEAVALYRSDAESFAEIPSYTGLRAKSPDRELHRHGNPVNNKTGFHKSTYLHWAFTVGHWCR